MARLLNRQQVIEVQGAINLYRDNKNDTNFDSIFNKIREYNLDPAQFMLHVSSQTTARVVEAMLDLVRKRAALEAEREGVNIEDAVREAVTNAANYTTGNEETPLVEALINPNTKEIEKIVKLLLEKGADPNNDRRERENFFHAIYEDEMNSGHLPERMAMLQRIRDLLHDKQFQFNAPFYFERFRPQVSAAPQAEQAQAEQAQAAANENIIGGKKKKKKRTQKKKKRTQKKNKKSMKKRNTKTHRKK
jgi:hypothetical protein